LCEVWWGKVSDKEEWRRKDEECWRNMNPSSQLVRKEKDHSEKTLPHNVFIQLCTMRYTEEDKDCSVDFGDDEAHHPPSIIHHKDSLNPE